MGGTVTLASTSQGGSEFHLILPTDVSPIIEMRTQQEEKRKKEKEMREQTLSKEKAMRRWAFKTNSIHIPDIPSHLASL